MSVQFHPSQQPINRVTRLQDEQSVIVRQRRRSFGDTLEIRQETSVFFFVCFKNCFQSILDFFKRLFSKEGSKEIDLMEAVKTIGAVSNKYPHKKTITTTFVTHYQDEDDPQNQARAEAPAVREVPEP